MPPRSRLRLFLVLTLAPLAVAAAAAAFLVNGSESDDGSGPYRGSAPPAGLSLPAFALPDHEGTVLDSSALRGRAVLVTFLDTQCGESCPLIASIVGQALDRLPDPERGEVAAVAISTDPDEDTKSAVEGFLARHRVQERLSYLVAPVGTLRPVWNAFQISASFDTGDDDLHSAPVRIYDREGRWVSTLHAGVDLTPENLVHDLEAALAEATG